MATVYFKNTVNGAWDSIENWYSDSARTVPVGNIPQNGDEVWMGYTGDTTTPLYTADPSSPVTLTNIYFVRGTVNTGGTRYVNMSNITAETINVFGGMFPRWYLHGKITGNLIISGSNVVGPTSSQIPVIVEGNVDSSQISGDLTVAVTGSVTCSNSIILRGAVLGDCSFYGNTYNQSTINGNATFYGSSANQGEVLGELVFNESSKYQPFDVNPIHPTSAVFNDNSTYLFGNMQTSATFNNNSHFAQGTFVGDITFNDSAYAQNNAVISGSVILNGDAYNEGIVTVDLTVGGTGTDVILVNPASPFGTVLGNVKNENGDNIESITFDGTTNEESFQLNLDFTFINEATNDGTVGTSTSNCYFQDSSENSGTVNGNLIFVDQLNSIGTVEGNLKLAYSTDTNITFTSNFSGTVNGLIINSTDEQIVSITMDGSSYSGQVDNIDLNFINGSYFEGGHTGDVTFNDTSYMSSGTITGDVILNEDASIENGDITGDIFFTNQLNDIGGNITGNCILSFLSSGSLIVDGVSLQNISGDYLYSTLQLITNIQFVNNAENYKNLTGDYVFDSSQNYGEINGNVTFNGESSNNSSVYGTASLYGDSTSNGSIEYGILNDNSNIQNGTYTTIKLYDNSQVYSSAQIENLFMYDSSSFQDGYPSIQNLKIVSPYVVESILQSTIQPETLTIPAGSGGINGSAILGLL